MNLVLRRVALKPTYTIGKLSVDNVYECDTLEDTVRDINKDGDLNDAGEGKVYGETAIPYGIYNVTITYSNRFKKDLPLIENVPGFEGIRIHPGNTAVDTHGCLLVGKNKSVGSISESVVTFKALYAKIKAAFDSGEKITLTIL